jgi:enoyl-CoA hydratase/carnithine racemase
LSEENLKEDYPMFYQTISLKKTDHVMVISIPRLGDPAEAVRCADELREVCAGINYEEEIRVVVLTGAEEESFVIEMGLNGEAPKENNEPQTRFYSLGNPIAKLDQPVIAAISGDAIGQGLELVLACDIRIASETSRFGLPQIESGVIPRDGGTQRLSRLVGKGKALEMILTGEIIDAREALRIGLVHKVVPTKDLTEVTMKMAKEMASKGPIALRYTKEAVYKGMDMILEQGLRLEADLYLLIHTSKDRTEGIQAFREKKTPRFEGK